MQPFAITAVVVYKGVMDLLQEKELVNSAKSGDKEAFGLLFDDNYGKIYGYILKRTGNVALTDDLTSDTFFKALTNLKKFRWQGIPFSSWLYKIATNEINGFFKKNKAHPLSLNKISEDNGREPENFRTPESEIMEMQEEIERHDFYLLVLKEMKQLKIKYQEVLSLRFFEKKKINEIAQILGKREGTVKSLLSRGIDKLKVKLEKTENLQPFSDSEVIKTKEEKI
ncbi:sigma-70 family RNA polymerase sigma factor [Candidatus Parcubacteria bacterium]|nr:MAG: sigma-70 family RNA polymerase sigma factor [Candidatus Parcubacteria bacterium]